MTKKGEKMVLVAAVLLEYDEKLSRIESLIEYENILTGIKLDLCQVFRHIFLRIYIIFSSFA